MKKIFDLLLVQYPLVITHTYLFELLDAPTAQRMFSLELLNEGKHIQSIICFVCGQLNDVLFESDGGPYYVCSCSGRSDLQENEIRSYSLDLIKFLRQVQTALNMAGSLEEKTEGKIWSMGNVSRAGKTLEVYFLRSNHTLSEQAESIIHVKFKIIFYLGQTMVQNSGDFYINFADLLSLESDKVVINEPVLDNFILSNVKEVLLDQNGDLYISYTKVYTFKTDTPEYLFLRYLFDRYDNVCANTEIHHAVESEYKKLKRQQTWAYEDDEDLFCRKMKSGIKNKIKNVNLKKTFDNCLIATRINQDVFAYRLTNPLV